MPMEYGIDLDEKIRTGLIIGNNPALAASFAVLASASNTTRTPTSTKIK